LHDVSDHDAGWAADQERAEEIAKGEHESEGGSREQTWKRKRNNDAEKRGARAGAEIVRRFDKVARDVFERSIERQEDERRVDVREGEDNGEGAVEEEADWLVGDVEILQKAVEDAVGAENGFPGLPADEIADRQRNNDQLVEKFFARTGVKGHVVGERVG